MPVSWVRRLLPHLFFRLFLRAFPCRSFRLHHLATSNKECSHAFALIHFQKDRNAIESRIEACTPQVEEFIEAGRPEGAILAGPLRERAGACGRGRLATGVISGEKKAMVSLEQKKEFILKHEEGFAFILAREVLKAPKFNIWMILIPIIIIYFIYQNRKVMDGRKSFAQNYLVSRRRALEESLACLKEGRRSGIDFILKESDLPAEAKGPFKEFFSLLVDHYEDLLRSDGEDMASLIRSTYKNRMNYLLFVNRLNEAERALNAALRPYMVKNMDEIHDVVKTMERVSEMLRRENALRIFG